MARPTFARITRPVSALRLLISFYLVLSLLAQSTPASTAAPPKDPLGRDTPQHSIYNFLEACHANHFHLAAKYLDLRHLPGPEQQKEGPEIASELAQILDQDVKFDITSLSNDPEGDRFDGLSSHLERLDSFTIDGKKIQLELERVALRQDLQVWLVSSGSISEISRIFKLRTESSFEKYLPEPLVSMKFLDTSVWRWIAFALLVLILAVLSSWLCRAVLFAVRVAARRAAPRLNVDRLNMFVGPVRLLVFVAGLRAGIEVVAPAALVRLYLGRFLSFLSFLGIAWLLMRGVDLLTDRLRVTLDARQRAVSHSVLSLGGRFVKLTIILAAALGVLASWGYNTTTFLAGLGVGGLAVALAAQKTLENLFGGVSVISDRPVLVGDTCKVGDRSGVIEDIGLRSTKIRTTDRTIVTIPNGQLSTMTLENYSRRDKMLFNPTLNLRRDTTPDQVRQVLQSISQLLRQHEKIEVGNIPVRMIGIGKYSLDIEVLAYVRTIDNDEFLRAQQDLLLQILDAVQAAGAALAIPTQAILSYDGNKNGGPPTH
ncbi:MAG TPA: mechanosensitive ion channel family protein [Bryobacteraceae bacterium]|nr:mechanosensitive ion channel family protein [Bryobacteraceae bacterium]